MDKGGVSGVFNSAFRTPNSALATRAGAGAEQTPVPLLFRSDQFVRPAGAGSLTRVQNCPVSRTTSANLLKSTGLTTYAFAPPS